jgi:hypothetical protein
MNRHPDHSLIALGIRQPWVELILRGIKTIEVRTVTTNVRGPIYIYSSKIPSALDQAVSAAERHAVDIEELSYGQLVGTVEIVDCRPLTSRDLPAASLSRPLDGRHYAWVLANPQRLEIPLDAKYLPYGIWFYPFQRRGGGEKRRSQRH